MSNIPNTSLQQIKNHIIRSINHKENYTPVANQTDIVLSATQQAIFTANSVKYMVIYINGLRMDESDDYTYNSSNYTLTFVEPFDGGEKVTVVISYFDDSATDKSLFATNEKYEKPYERVKTFTTYSSASVNLDIDNFNLFILDFRTNTPNTLTVNIPSTSGPSIGKSVMLSIMFSSTVPTITWSSNVIWNTSDTTAPTFEANKSYNISFFQVNSTTKYIGNVNSYFTTSNLIISS